MTARPRLLDLFCSEGGAGAGYAAAGFDVTGVDLRPQPRYPHAFHRADALDFLADHGHEYQAVHASPPCQSYSRSLKHLAHAKPQLVDAVRDLLVGLPVVWVIENVEGAPLLTQPDLFNGEHGVLVCGTGLGLPVWRHRIFQSNVPLTAPGCRHGTVHAMNPHSQAGRDRIYAEHGRRDPELVWRDAMGVGWMTRQGARESVPPAYTELLGRQMLDHVRAA